MNTAVCVAGELGAVVNPVGAFAGVVGAGSVTAACYRIDPVRVRQGCLR